LIDGAEADVPKKISSNKVKVLLPE